MYLRLLLIGALAAGFGCAQEGGGGGSGRAGAGYAAPPAPNVVSPLQRMTTVCTLSKDQAKQFSAILDAASKSAADLRKQIPGDRGSIAAAVQAGKSPEEIKKLVDADGLAVAQMTQIEMKAYADLRKLLDPDQIKAGGARVYGMLVGMFMKKNWND
jgi:Spy/CpxP family protein refolding chaperone